MYPIAIGLAIRSHALWSEVTASLRNLPFRVVFDHPDLDNPHALLERIGRAAPEVVLLECAYKPEKLGELVAAIRATPTTPLVIALQASPEVEGVVTALRAGVFEFLYPPIEENLRKALERAQGLVHRRPLGKVFGFLSAKGGCGATTIACHTAAALGRRATKQEKRALLVDLDLNTGMVRFLMRAKTPYSVLDAAGNLQKLDIGFWNALTASVAPGLEVIPAPAELVSKHQLTRDEVEHVLSFARSYYDWLTIDLGRGLGLLTMSVLEEIDELFLVTTSEVPALHLTKKIVEVLTARGYSEKKLHLIMNRSHAHVPPSLKEVEALLGMPLYANLPSDYARLREAYAECRLLPAGAGLGQELDWLAGRMVGEEAETQAAGAGWLAGLRLFGRRSQDLT